MDEIMHEIASTELKPTKIIYTRVNKPKMLRKRLKSELNNLFSLLLL